MKNLFGDTRGTVSPIGGTHAPFQRHSETSKHAAQAIEPQTHTLRGKVLAFIRAAGEHGATDLEIEAGTGIKGSTCRPRRIELQRMGFIRPKGEDREGAAVWVAR